MNKTGTDTGIVIDIGIDVVVVIIGIDVIIGIGEGKLNKK